MSFLSGEQGATAIVHMNLAHSTGALSATCGWNKEFVVTESIEESSTSFCGESFVWIIIDDDLNITTCDELGLGRQ